MLLHENLAVVGPNYFVTAATLSSVIDERHASRSGEFFAGPFIKPHPPDFIVWSGLVLNGKARATCPQLHTTRLRHRPRAIIYLEYCKRMVRSFNLFIIPIASTYSAAFGLPLSAMKLSNILPAAMAIAQALAAAFSRSPTLQAYVYRGPASCDGCPESVGELLESSCRKINVTYVGPNEDIDITAESLSEADIYVHPGGGGRFSSQQGPVSSLELIDLLGLDEAWKHMKQYKPVIRDFVQNGGRYLGFCLGAYLAGHDPGFDLLSSQDDADEEVSQPGAQVDDEEDTVIQVDWTFASGPKKGKTDHKRWLYFQDGASFKLSKTSSATILGRYSSNGDPAAILTTFGEGWVGLVGPHPEADQDWCECCVRNDHLTLVANWLRQTTMQRSATPRASIST